ARIERIAVVARVIFADRAACLHGEGVEAIVEELELRHMRRLGEGRVDGIDIAHAQGEAGVVGRFGIDLRRALLYRIARAHHRRQHLVVDIDELGRIPRTRLAVGDDQRNALADIAHLVDRQGIVLGAMALRTAEILGIASGLMVPSPSAAQSLPVSTATTPGAASAAVLSIARILAWACGEKRNTPCAWRGKSISAT